MSHLFELEIGNAEYDSGSCGKEHGRESEVTVCQCEEQEGGKFGEAQFKKRRDVILAAYIRELITPIAVE